MPGATRAYPKVAREAFRGAWADARLDHIAKQAQVGPATLYRHFPTREALMEAVYRSEVERLAAAAGGTRASYLQSRLCARGCCFSWTASPRSTSSRRH